MALSYLIGSQGNFGQAKLRSSASTVRANRADSYLVLSDSDADLFVELLANVLNRRGKDGDGGGNYLPGTFDPGCVIFSLRCLLTHTGNQSKLARRRGLELHTLLINALSRHVFEPSSAASLLDSESAGHIVFGLYLLSNHCFAGAGSPFLPKAYGRQRKHAPSREDAIDDDDEEEEEEQDPGMAANIFGSYLRLPGVPPEGRHAARQLLLRLDYLRFEDRAPPITPAVSWKILEAMVLN